MPETIENLSADEILAIVQGMQDPNPLTVLTDRAGEVVIGAARVAEQNGRKVVVATALTGTILGTTVSPVSAQERNTNDPTSITIEQGDTLSEAAEVVGADWRTADTDTPDDVQAGEVVRVCATGQDMAKAGDTVASMSEREQSTNANFLVANPDVANHPKQWVFEGQCYNRGGGEERSVRVNEGDTVYEFADGDPKLIQAIVDVNGLSMWRDGTVIIRPGQELIIPSLEPTVNTEASLDTQIGQLLGSEHRGTVVLPEGEYISNMAKAVNEVTGIPLETVQAAMLSANEGEHFQLGDPLDIPGFSQDIANQALALLNPHPTEISTRTLEQIAATGLPPETVPKIEALKPDALALESIYRQAEEVTGVPWEVLAAVHFEEANNDPERDLQAGNPLGTGGSQYSVRGAQSDLLTSVINAGNDLQHSAEHGRFGKRIDRANLDLEVIKDALFSHNGRSSQYAAQAAEYGFDPEVAPYEGSPYVSEGLTPEQQSMGRITIDHGGIDDVASRPGAVAVAIGLGLLDGHSTPEQVLPPAQEEASPSAAGIAGETLDDVETMVSKLEVKELNGVPTVEVYGMRIQKDIAVNLARMVQAAKADGIDLTGGGWRSNEEQKALREQNCPDPENSPPSDCYPATAKPGTSNHERALAVDFDNSGTRDTEVYQWLEGRAAEFEFYNLPSEPWHWSVNGR